MRIARISRGFDPRVPVAAGATARGVGALFIRSYERGERVHLAMVVRGYTGTMPRSSRRPRPDGSGRRPHSRRGRRRCRDGHGVPRPDRRRSRSRPGLRLPRRPPGPVRRRPARRPRRAGRAARPQRRRQDHPRAAPQRHPHRAAPARSRSAGCRSTKANLRGDPPPGRHRLPGPRRPAVHADRRARTSRSARPTSGLRGAELDERVDEALAAVGMARASPTGPPHHLSFGQRRRVARRDRAGHASRRSSCWTSRRPTSTRPPAASSPTSCASLDVTRADGHPRPAVRPASCARAPSSSTTAVVVADGPTRELLADADLLRTHRLELPFGFVLS